jgi:hypothetical protein
MISSASGGTPSGAPGAPGAPGALVVVLAVVLAVLLVHISKRNTSRAGGTFMIESLNYLCIHPPQ